MMETSDRSVRESLLARHGRAIIHMRQQMVVKQFGLILGAGVSVGLGFPDWKELIQRIANHRELRGRHLLGKQGGNTSQSQLLFQHYRAKQLAEATREDHVLNRLESRVQAGWQQIVHDALYRDTPKTASGIIGRDQYLQAFLNVIRSTPLTINYNFDDSIQRMLAETRTEEERRTRRGHTTVWSANIQMFPKDAVIYHPNGYLPHSLGERPSEHLVFLEDSFADQLIQSMAGHYTALSYHFAQATRLLLGLSLADQNLKHLLRQNAHCHPGHYHYHVAYVHVGAKRDYAYEKTVADANFEVYNLVTMFLTAAEIAALGELLDMQAEEFQHLAEEVGNTTTLRFLLTGPVGVGKSTALSHFRSLHTHDEWLEQRHPEMERNPADVDSDTISRIDAWVMKQLNLKNLVMRDAKPGIHLVDRAPLDAFAFTPEQKWRQKASMIRGAISPGESERSLVSAHIILMIGDPEVIAARAIIKHRHTNGAALSRQQDLLKKVYGTRRRGVTVIDTRDKTIPQVAKEVGRIVHRAEFAEAPLHKWLTLIEKGKIHG